MNQWGWFWSQWSWWVLTLLISVFSFRDTTSGGQLSQSSSSLQSCGSREAHGQRVWWFLLHHSEIKNKDSNKNLWFMTGKTSSSLPEDVMAKTLFLLQSIFQTDWWNPQRPPSDVKAADNSSALVCLLSLALNLRLKAFVPLRMAGNHSRARAAGVQGRSTLQGRKIWKSPN